MSTLLAEDLALDWLVGYLEADTTLSGLINGVVPEAVWGTLASPFVRIDRLEANDLMVIGMTRIWTDCLYHVRGCLHWRGQGQPDRTDVNQIGARIDQLLHGHEANTATVRLHAFREESTPDPAVIDGSELWLQSGGTYRLRATAV
jgi:hypothetical protein